MDGSTEVIDFTKEQKMVWLVMGAYEGEHGIEVVFKNQSDYSQTSRFFGTSYFSRRTFVGTPVHKIRVTLPGEYKFNTKDFLGKFCDT
ncbi:MAG: hypothetical protein B7C24_15325 [Bacteroidetes bacterium 4572_77]|nr:MAG: hypothetical protein B7C24_15325 [Bacteroidetes bacterium 4572_77]